jgi:hypothetical protein
MLLAVLIAMTSRGGTTTVVIIATLPINEVTPAVITSRCFGLQKSANNNLNEDRVRGTVIDTLGRGVHIGGLGLLVASKAYSPVLLHAEFVRR